MATQADADQVNALVADAAQVLDWCALTEAQLDDEVSGEVIPAMPVELRESYRAAVGQLREFQVRLAQQALADADQRLLSLLASAGWEGPLLEFKLGVLERSGRSAVVDATAPSRGGVRIRRRLLGSFLGALNAALDSLRFVPGVAAIKELKDFVEKAQRPAP